MKYFFQLAISFLSFFVSENSFGQSKVELGISGTLFGGSINHTKKTSADVYCLGCGRIELINPKVYYNAGFSISFYQKFRLNHKLSLFTETGFNYFSNKYDYTINNYEEDYFWQNAVYSNIGNSTSGNLNFHAFYFLLSVGGQIKFSHLMYCHLGVQPELLVFNNSVENYSGYSYYTKQDSFGTTNHTSNFDGTKKPQMNRIEINAIGGIGHSFDLSLKNKLNIELDFSKGINRINNLYNFLNFRRNGLQLKFEFQL